MRTAEIRSQPVPPCSRTGQSSPQELFVRTRATTEAIVAPLSAEDRAVQSMPDASPTKWHLAHVTWFFETFLLAPFLPDYRRFDERYAYLFNSYYDSIGTRHPRPQRGLLTRPSAAEVGRYRTYVDEAMAALLSRSEWWPQIAYLVELGINHEQQHQELILMDILHAFACNPLYPAYHSPEPIVPRTASRGRDWFAYPAGLYDVGYGGAGFAFDNEGPRHRVILRPFKLAARPVSNGEWQAFVDDGGYRRPEPWLSDGWATAQSAGWNAPLYWRAEESMTMTLGGPQPIDSAAPVCHISYYEADAYARWAGKRLPTEAEWEVAAQRLPPMGNTLATGALRPLPALNSADVTAPNQMFGDVWEWTSSPYAPYPGYRTPAGAIGEYNGKFMCNQMVLRGGSCVTPDGHVRATYRNFFYPHQRWQFSGVRLAEDD